MSMKLMPPCAEQSWSCMPLCCPRWTVSTSWAFAASSSGESRPGVRQSSARRSATVTAADVPVDEPPGIDECRDISTSSPLGIGMDFTHASRRGWRPNVTFCGSSL